jgi:hypothetical protein
VRSVSSNVMLPELPDAKMETRRPIEVSPQFAMSAAAKFLAANFYDDGRARHNRQRGTAKTIQCTETVRQFIH